MGKGITLVTMIGMQESILDLDSTFSPYFWWFGGPENDVFFRNKLGERVALSVA